MNAVGASVRELLPNAISIGDVHQLSLFEGVKQLSGIARIVPVAFQLIDERALFPEELPTLLDMPFSFFQALK